MPVVVKADQVPVPEMHPPLNPQFNSNKVNLEQQHGCLQQLTTVPGIYAVDRGSVYRLEDTRGPCAQIGYVGYHATSNKTSSGAYYQPQEGQKVCPTTLYQNIQLRQDAATHQFRGSGSVQQLAIQLPPSITIAPYTTQFFL